MAKNERERKQIFTPKDGYPQVMLNTDGEPMPSATVDALVIGQPVEFDRHHIDLTSLRSVMSRRRKTHGWEFVEHELDPYDIRVMVTRIR